MSAVTDQLAPQAPAVLNNLMVAELAARGHARQIPNIAQLSEYCRGAINRAAHQQWPDGPVTLRGHVPSVTGFVHRIDVGGVAMYAKTSLLGASLVSVMRGRHGSWPSLQAAQQHYIRYPDNLLQREAAQLRFLADHGLQTTDATLIDGVLFTRPVPGDCLTQIALQEPARLAELLALVWQHLALLHTSTNTCATITERDITATFTRKFRDQPNQLDRLGLADQPKSAVDGLLRAVALVSQLPPPIPATGLIYGDLKPEHILVAADAAMTFIDPGITTGPATADLGKLTSRLLLALACTPPQPTRDSLLVGAVHEFAHRLALTEAVADRSRWWRELVALWLRDTLNILSTYLAAPPDLPLPTQGRALVRQTEQVCGWVEMTAAILLRHPDPGAAWSRGLAEVLAR